MIGFSTKKNNNMPRANKRTKKTQFQNGGKFIDKGGFGCVVSPALPCSKKDKDKELHKLVSKIVKSPTKEITNELKISGILKKIDFQNKYFITYNKYCNINKIPENRNDIINVHYVNDSLSKFTISPGQSDKDSKSCDIELSLRPINIIMSFAGYSLSTIMKTNKNSSGIKSIMHNEFIKNLKIYIKHLILGIIKMHNNRIVHRDIKQKNIMLEYNKKTKKMTVKYIDFGLSDFLSSEYCSQYSNISIKGTPYYLPPENIIIYYMNKYKNQNDKNLLKHILYHIEGYYKKAMTRIGKNQEIKLINNKILELYKKIKYLWEKQKILPAYFGTEINKFNGYLQKGDIYSLGLCIYETLYAYSKYNLDDNMLLNDLLQNMITIDPDKRYNGIQCLAHKYFHS
jgi:serine/threonine protein kinase